MSDDVVELDVIAPAEGKRWVERSRNCQFYAVNQAALHLADLIKCRPSTERTQTPESVDIAHQRAIALREHNRPNPAVRRLERQPTSIG